MAKKAIFLLVVVFATVAVMLSASPPGGVEAKDLLPVAVQQAAEHDTFWNIYIAVATAILLLMASGRVKTNDTKVLLTLGFAVFAISNMTKMLFIQRALSALLGLIVDPDLHEFVQDIRPPYWYGFVIYHLLIDAMVVFAIWRVRWTGKLVQTKK